MDGTKVDCASSGFGLVHELPEISEAHGSSAVGDGGGTELGFGGVRLHVLHVARNGGVDAEVGLCGQVGLVECH